VPTYGPFHRRQTPTQTLDTAARQVLSNEQWGRIPGWNSGLLQVPTVQAYRGALPVGIDGTEFVTEVAPGAELPTPRWFPDTPGVTPVEGEPDTVRIAARVVRVRQSR
jgi:hypothetical protein